MKRKHYRQQQSRIFIPELRSSDQKRSISSQVEKIVIALYGEFNQKAYGETLRKYYAVIRGDDET